MVELTVEEAGMCWWALFERRTRVDNLDVPNEMLQSKLDFSHKATFLLRKLEAATQEPNPKRERRSFTATEA